MRRHKSKRHYCQFSAEQRSRPRQGRTTGCWCCLMLIRSSAWMRGRWRRMASRSSIWGWSPASNTPANPTIFPPLLTYATPTPATSMTWSAWQDSTCSSIWTDPVGRIIVNSNYRIRRRRRWNSTQEWKGWGSWGWKGWGMLLLEVMKWEMGWLIYEKSMRERIEK